MHTFVKIVTHDGPVPAGKLADAELHFSGDDLDGLKLIGFGIWRGAGGQHPDITFPARQFTVHGERRSYCLLRPTEDPRSSAHLRDLILQAYQAHAQTIAGEASPD